MRGRVEDSTHIVFQVELEEQQAMLGEVAAQIEAAEVCRDTLQGRLERAMDAVQRLHERAEALKGTARYNALVLHAHASGCVLSRILAA